ncbi:NADH:ubiquinone oxidoreductase subunit M [Achromatium sp. WMS2]|nr:NADH:ubiquinone oxidoreductase subunit M [Achromatium sp. WMS2]
MTLLWIILIPLIGGVLCMRAERFSKALVREIALVTMSIVTLMSLQLWLNGNFTAPDVTSIAPHWAFEIQYPWISRFGISFHLGVDGLSMLLVFLTGLVGLWAIACSWDDVQEHVGFFYFNLLWLLSGVIGVFLALDLFLFFFFWELMLIPMYFLIALWGHDVSIHKTRFHAAVKFFVYTQASGMLMLFAILGLVFANYSNTGSFSFDYSVLRNTALTPTVEYLIMLGFFIAFAVKLPVPPLHSWLPDAHGQAPTAGSVILAGLLLKTAGYGLLRFAVPMFPHASLEFAPIAMILGCISIIYTAILAFAQTDLKRLIAYTSISHMGFILIAIYAGEMISMQGAVLQMVAHGLSASALFILAGQLYERLHTRDLTKMGGLWTRLPIIPAFALFFVAASLGLPGTGNFVGEFLILLGAFPVAPWSVVIASTGLVLASIYSLVLMQRAFYGAPSDPNAAPLNGPVLREVLILGSLVIMMLAMGFYPQPLVTTASSSITAVRDIYRPQSVAPVPSLTAP